MTIYKLASCLVVGLFFLYAAVSEFLAVKSAEEAPSWPKVTAVVGSSSVAPNCDRSGHYSAKVQYAYKVGESIFTGNALNYLAYNCHSAERAAAIASEYPVGTTIEVHVNPRSPAESVVNPSGSQDVGWKLVVVLALGFCFSIAGALVYSIKLRNTRGLRANTSGET